MPKIINVKISAEVISDRIGNEDKVFSEQDIFDLVADVIHEKNLARSEIFTESINSFDELDVYKFAGRNIRFIRTQIGTFGLYEHHGKFKATFTSETGKSFILCEHVDETYAFTAYSTYYDLISEAGPKDKTDKKSEEKEKKAAGGTDPNAADPKAKAAPRQPGTQGQPGQPGAMPAFDGGKTHKNFTSDLKPGEKGKPSVAGDDDSPTEKATLKPFKGSPIRSAHNTGQKLLDASNTNRMV